MMWNFAQNNPQDFDGNWTHHPMMWGAGSGAVFWVWAVLSWITWILVIVALIALIRWLWKKGDKK